MFGADIYVRIMPFSTTRLLVGHFESAERTLKAAVARAGGRSSFLVSPNVLMHPLEMVEGGLSQIEERVLHELAIGADEEVSAKLSSR